MTDERNKKEFEKIILSLQTEVANAGAHLSWDGAIRSTYANNIAAMSTDISMQVKMGGITWVQAATRANEMRNAIMTTLRSGSTPIGKALAQSIKKEGLSFNELIGKKAMQLYGKDVNFDALSAAKKDAIFASIVDSAGKDNPFWSTAARVGSRAGKALLVLSIAVSVYNIASAKDKVDATKREVTVTGASIAGGIAGGALAGMACGPGAPACIVIGAFVSGALAALGLDFWWSHIGISNHFGGFGGGSFSGGGAGGSW